MSRGGAGSQGGGPWNREGLRAAPCVHAGRCSSGERGAQHHATAMNSRASVGGCQRQWDASRGGLQRRGEHEQQRACRDKVWRQVSTVRKPGVKATRIKVKLLRAGAQSEFSGRQAAGAFPGGKQGWEGPGASSRGAHLQPRRGSRRHAADHGSSPFQACTGLPGCSGRGGPQLLVLAYVRGRQPGEGRRVGGHNLWQPRHARRRRAAGRDSHARARQRRLWC